MTNTKLSAESMLSLMSSSHRDAGGMSSQSTQTSLPLPVRNVCSSRTKAPSAREYEMNTSAKASALA